MIQEPPPLLRLRRDAPIAVSLACTLWFLGACTDVEASDPFMLGPDTPVVLVLIDTLRADRLSCYGYELETSPYLDELASRSYVFEANSTQCNSTFPSITSIFTGVYPKTHGNYLSVPIQGLASQGKGLQNTAERFHQRDYYTVAVTSHPSWAIEQDVDAILWRGWDRLSHLGDPIPIEERPIHARAENTNERMFALLDEYDRQASDQPLFLWAHYFDPHTNLSGNLYDPPQDIRNEYFDHHFEALGLSEYADTLRPMDPTTRNEWIHHKGPSELKETLSLAAGRAGYDAEILACDRGINELFERLETSGVLDEALIIVMSDHGENMEEFTDSRQARPFTHARLYDGVSHTPLIIHMPGQTEGRRIDSITQNIDVLPTLLQLFDHPMDDRVEGRSLVPLMRGSQTSIHDTVFMESTVGRENAIRSEELKLIEGWRPGQVELYDWRNDPGELENLADSMPEGSVPALLEALEEFRPETRVGLRFAPMDEPYDVDIVAYMPGAQIAKIEGLPESTLSEDRQSFRWSGSIGPQGLEVSLQPQTFAPNQEVRWSLRHTGREDLQDAVWLGRTPVSQTPAIPIYDLIPKLAPKQPRYVVDDDMQAGTTRVVVDHPGAQSIECEVRYTLPRNYRNFEVLETEGFQERHPPLAYHHRADAFGVDRASLTLGLTHPRTPRYILLRVDGRWPEPSELLFNKKGVNTKVLRFLFPSLPHDFRLPPYMAVTPPPVSELPPGTICIWQESGGGGGEIDAGGVSSEMARQLSAIGYLGDAEAQVPGAAPAQSDE